QPLFPASAVFFRLRFGFWCGLFGFRRCLFRPRLGLLRRLRRLLFQLFIGRLLVACCKPQKRSTDTYNRNKTKGKTVGILLCMNSHACLHPHTEDTCMESFTAREVANLASWP